MATAQLKTDHVVVFSRSCLDVETDSLVVELREHIGHLVESVYSVVAISHKVGNLRNQIQKMGLNISCKARGKEIRDYIKDQSSQGRVVVIIGAVDEDLNLAASTKSFLIGGSWVDQEEKVIKYGIPTPSPTKMKTVVDIIANQTVWYYKLTFDDPVPTKVVALCSANTYGRSVDPDEREIAEKIQAVLKNGDENPSVKKALMCHLMAAIAHDPDFKEVQDWACAPSSSTNQNEVMEDLKEHVRYMMNGKKGDPIFLRHTTTGKSRFDSCYKRQQANYCQKHFQSIKLSDKYKGKLRGRVVCVLDDYLTHGNTFEALRNLLVSCKVKKIIFVAIGKFISRGETKYIQRNFDIRGDVFSPGYHAEFKEKRFHKIETQEAAKRSLGELNTLARSLVNLPAKN